MTLGPMTAGCAWSEMAHRSWHPHPRVRPRCVAASVGCRRGCSRWAYCTCSLATFLSRRWVPPWPGTLAIDFLHLVKSRLALLEILVALFAVAAFLACTYERDEISALSEVKRPGGWPFTSRRPFLSRAWHWAMRHHGLCTSVWAEWFWRSSQSFRFWRSPSSIRS